MKPCSAWCRPDEGVHVVVGWSRRPRGHYPAVGSILRSRGNACLPSGARAVVLDASEYVEGDKPEGTLSDEWNFIATVQVITESLVLP